jgi:hypothetical protein
MRAILLLVMGLALAGCTAWDGRIADNPMTWLRSK